MLRWHIYFGIFWFVGALIAPAVSAMEESAGEEESRPWTDATEIYIDRPVVDLYGAMEEGPRDQLEEILWDHHEATGVQMAVLFVDSTGSVAIEDFSLAVAERWQGGSAERDDGVLLVFALDDRRNRLELGYGIEPLISDAMALRMLSDATPLLREERYGEAAAQIAGAVIEQTDSTLEDGERIASPRGRVHESSDRSSVLLWDLRAQAALVVVFYLSVIHGLGVWRLRRRRRSRAEEEARERQESYNPRPTLRLDLLWLFLPAIAMMALCGGQNLTAYLVFGYGVSTVVAMGCRIISPLIVVAIVLFVALPFVFGPIPANAPLLAEPHLMEIWLYQLTSFQLWFYYGATTFLSLNLSVMVTVIHYATGRRGTEYQVEPPMHLSSVGRSTLAARERHNPDEWRRTRAIFRGISKAVVRGAKFSWEVSKSTGGFSGGGGSFGGGGASSSW